MAGIVSRAGLVCIALSICTQPAWGAHPFVTDDPITQGKGNFELQLGSSFTRTSTDGTTFSSIQFSPQLSYGIVDTVDLQVRPNYNVDFGTGGEPQRASGFGDTFVGFKWRCIEAREWTSAIAAGSGFPSGNAARGLDAGRATPYGYFNTMWSNESLQVQSTFGAIRNAAIADGRAWLAHASAAVLWRPRLGWQVGVDVIADQNPMRSMSQWPAAALLGFIYTATHFLDLDVGYQRRLNRSAPDNQYLLGATFRW